jgi:pyruvate/2-oxoglutarate dehydrogenase complex dihydrolipoamide acyltransferase (E2) component
MSIQITMPALSPTMEEGNLAKWHVKVGDMIEPGQVIAEIETDKATMEVEAVDEGVIEEILVAEGAQGVKVNTPIARLKGEGEAKPAPTAQVLGWWGGGGRPTPPPRQQRKNPHPPRGRKSRVMGRPPPRRRQSA